MDSDQAKLFVGGISRETNEETLRAHFRSYGTVLGSVIAKDRSNHNPRGFGFVWFSDISSADKALEDPHVILGRTVEVKKAIPRPRNQHQSRMLSRSVENGTQLRTKKIFVGGLSAGLTEDGFKNYFEKFGSVSDVVVMHDYKTRRPRGFGFITFDSEDSVENVMQESFHELNGRSVEVKRAVPKEENGNNESGYTDYAPRFPRIYPPYTCSPAPTYGVLPFPTPYNGLGPFAYGTSVYGGGWYPSVAACGTPYGIAPIAPQPWVFPYGNALYPGYMSGGGSAAGSYNGILGPAVFTGGKPNQVVFGSGLPPVNVKPSQVEVKLDVDSRSNSTTVKKKNSKRNGDIWCKGWFLSAYFLGGFGEDGRGVNGQSKALTATAKSWALGIPLGIIIRASTAGHIPPIKFALVTMGSTGVLLVGWRALLYKFLPGDKSKKSDVYRRGSPFELFELLT